MRCSLRAAAARRCRAAAPSQLACRRRAASGAAAVAAERGAGGGGGGAAPASSGEARRLYAAFVSERVYGQRADAARLKEAFDAWQALGPAERREAGAAALRLAATRVDMAQVRVTGCSSVMPDRFQAPGARCGAEHTVEQTSRSWWMSAPGSCPKGRGAEWVEYEINPGAPGRARVGCVQMAIPPMPSGPMSVRTFHVETADARAGPWKRASADFRTQDTDAEQEFLLDPPAEGRHLRVVCSENAVASMANGRDHEFDCVGFYHVSFA